MIYLLIPVFNEEGNITNLFHSITEVMQNRNYTVVFSDDGSVDNTKKIIQQEFASTPHVILGDGKNYGPGNAFNVGFEYILNDSKNNDDIIISMEADCTSDTSILPTMLLLNGQGYNLVLSSVYAQGGGFDETSLFRKFLSAFANLLFRFLFDIKVLTLSSFYRVYSVGLLRKIKVKYPIIIEEKGFICMLEVLLKAIACESNIIEVPMVLHSKKRVGKSKMKIFKTTLSYFNYLFRIKFSNKL